MQTMLKPEWLREKGLFEIKGELGTLPSFFTFVATLRKIWEVSLVFLNKLEARQHYTGYRIQEGTSSDTYC